jgi:CubicO group peptidase (beta-lactamase class C family)
MRESALRSLLLLAFSATGAAQEASSGVPWERVENAAEAGFSRDLLDEVDAYARTLNTDGMVVVVGGRVLFEYGDVEVLSYVASVRKSILSMLYGNYVATGAIDLNFTLEEMGMDDVGGLLPIERRAKVEDLITARSGVYHPASNPGDSLADAPPRGSQEPGTYMLYSNWDFNAAGAVFERLTGQNIYDSLSTDLVEPLGLQDWDRARHRKSGDVSRSVNLAYHMKFSTRDMARFGELMLREGNWNGKQVIPRDWAKRIVAVITPSEEMNPSYLRGGEFGYGHMWWVWDGPLVPCAFKGAYTARGAFGQYITVIPELDMVVAHKTIPKDSTGWTQYTGLLNRIVAARTTPVCTDSEHPQALKEATQRTEIEVSESILLTLAGEYQFDSDRGFTLTVEDGALWAQPTGRPKVLLFAESETEFFLRGEDVQFTFTKDESGTVSGLTFHQDGQDRVLNKVR